MMMLEVSGFPKFGGTPLGPPITRTIIFWASILGSPYLGKLPYSFVGKRWETLSTLSSCQF